jgi:nucleoside-diphosphate-sugar epimerase
MAATLDADPRAWVETAAMTTDEEDAMREDEHLRVAVTGPTGTFGFGLVPLLEADPRIEAMVGVARRPFEPADHGWSKMTYRRGDVRDQALLREAFADCDVVVHLAFLIAEAGPDAAREINVEGTVHAFQAAAAAGARRFVYASSVSAYGFHPDNPPTIDETWPTRGAHRLAYSQEKAELEERLAQVAAHHPETDLYLLRPPVVVGPHVVGGKSALAERLLPAGRRLARLARGRRVHLPVPTLDLTLQVIHEEDVGRAFLQCIVGAGPPGAYNIAADGVLTAADVVRELGLHPITVGGGLLRRGARAIARVPTPAPLPPITSWAEAIGHPVIVDTAKAKRELGWKPEWTAEAALRDTIGTA